MIILLHLCLSLCLALRTTSASRSGVSSDSHASSFSPRAANSSACSLDQAKPPGDLTQCGNSTLFHVWRPRARFIAPEGWMNDPQGLFQREDGSFHAGYQCHPRHVQWGNISQCSATSKDFTYWTDLPSWENPETIWPSEIYDIRGVFDGSIIPKGWNGYPTTIYASTFVLPLGATSSPPEREGTETQSLAYTTDGGASWIKLNFGVNPVIYKWPEQNLTGFRDPFAFQSPRFAKLLADATSGAIAKGDYFLTVSGGIRLDADPNGGPRLFLYRQTANGDFTKWTYLGPIVRFPAKIPFPWSGNSGINFETAAVTRLNEDGHATDAGTDPDALDIITYGTEQGRNGSHEDHWPLWSIVSLAAQDGSISSTLKASGALDWGRTYAVTFMPVTTGRRNRIVAVGWTYEDDELLVLTKQRGYQGAFTLFRDLFVKVIRNVDPASATGNNNESTTSWITRTEADGSTSVLTLGQKVVPETLSAYRSKSRVSRINPLTLSGTAGHLLFPTQPRGRYYAVTGNFKLRGGPAAPKVGFRVLASEQEWTDVYYDLANESLLIDRSHNSLISTYGTETEVGKLRLFNIHNRTRGTISQEVLKLTIFVDNSVVEVYANDQTVITTRCYPWLSASKGVGFLSQGGGANSSVSVSDVELWDGLINAWPERPSDTTKGLVWDGPLLSADWGLWAGW